jgi:hypothetical protein
MQAGANPDGLAWHECRAGVELQAADLLAQPGLLDERHAKDVLVRLMLHRALVDATPVQQLAAGLKAMTDGRKKHEASSEAMIAFLAGPKAAS